MAVTQNTYTGNGSTVLYSFTFPYLEASDIKVSLNGTLTTAYSLANATTVQFNTAPTNGAAIVIYRDTANTALVAEFYPGSAIRAQDLNNDFTQGLYIAQESRNTADSAQSASTSATATANTALSQSSAAVNTANTASANASSAVTTANTASTNASAAVSTANTASSNASTAVTTANSAVTTANTKGDAAIASAATANTTAASAVTTANAATSTANTASTNAASAVSTANTASSNASAAVSTANTASGNASTAVTTANNAVTTANTANSNSNTAVTTANAAAAAVANAVLYTTVANVAAIPASPANNAAVEVTDSTGIESFTPLSGLPSGFVGSSGLSVRIIYQTVGATWTWIQYFPNDPEARYFKLAGGTLTGALASTLGTAALPSLTFTGDPNTGIYSPGADQVAISTNSVGRVFVDASGKVGVGTTPVYNFHATETVAVTSAASYSTFLGQGTRADLVLKATSSNNDQQRQVIRSNSDSLILGTENAAVSVFTEKLRIDSSGRLGVGTSSPSALLTVSSGEARLDLNATNASGRLWNLYSGGGGNVGSGSFAIAEGGATQRLVIVGGGSGEALRIDASNRVGIGTTSPHGTLQVHDGTFVLSKPGGGSDKNWRFLPSDAAAGDLAIQQSTTSGGTTYATKLTIDPSGRVGIGTTSPTRQLHVNSTAIFDTNGDGTGTNPSIAIGSNSVGLSYVGGAQLSFTTGSAEKARLTSDGKFLVGTSTSYANADVDELQIGNNSSATKTGITFGSTDQSGIAFADASDARAGLIEYTHSIDSLRFYTNGASNERARITSDGRFGVNTTNFANGRLITESDGTAITPFVVRDTAAGTSSVNSVGFFRNATQVGSIALTGSATAYNTSSDYRLKENVVAVPDGITRLQQLKPSRFNFIVDPDTVVDGFIAHEVQAIVPEAITGEKDAVDDDNNPVYQGIDQSKLVPLLTAALQEAIAKIETLEGMVAVNNITVDEQQHQLSTLAARLTALESA